MNTRTNGIYLRMVTESMVLRIGVFVLLTLIFSISSALANVQSASTSPVGFVTVTIPAGFGTTKKTSLISLPLLASDNTIPSQGVITGVKDAKTLLVNPLGAGVGGTLVLPAGHLSRPAVPFLLLFTSGEAEGLMFLVSSTTPNTESEITLNDPNDPLFDLRTLNIHSGDSFKLYLCDTLLSVFGTPETSDLKGGTSASNADTVTLVTNGSASTYFYSTSLGRWARVSLGSPDSNHVPLLPYYGIQYGRLANTDFSLVSTGEVPRVKRKVKVRASGPTLLAPYWPTDSNLFSQGLQSSPNWAAASSPSLADRVVMTTPAGSALTYTFDGQNWRRIGLGSSLSDSTAVSTGSAMLLNRIPGRSSHTILEQLPPYSL